MGWFFIAMATSVVCLGSAAGQQPVEDQARKDLKPHEAALEKFTGHVAKGEAKQAVAMFEPTTKVSPDLLVALEGRFVEFHKRAARGEPMPIIKGSKVIDDKVAVVATLDPGPKSYDAIYLVKRDGTWRLLHFFTGLSYKRLYKFDEETTAEYDKLHEWYKNYINVLMEK